MSLDRTLEHVYQRRAGHLARRRAAQPVAHTVPALVFGLGAERYAIELSELAEVLPFRGCTAVPGGPSSLLGVMNIRGEIRCLGDLRRILGMESAETTDDTGYVVMLRHHGRTVGFKVDTVENVREIDPTHLAAAGNTPLAGARFVKALTADGVIVVDARAAIAHLSPLFA